MTEKKRIVETTSFTGQPIRYEFMPMKVLDGFDVMHEIISAVTIYAEKIIPTVIKLMATLADEDETGEGKVQSIEDVLLLFKDPQHAELIKMIPVIFSGERIKWVLKKMLPGGKAVVDGTTYEFGDDGTAEYMEDCYTEVYLAVFNGLIANFPKELGPLLSALEESQGDEDLPPGKMSKTDQQ